MKYGITTVQERLAQNNIDAMERQAKRPDGELKAPVKDDRQVHKVRKRERGGVGKARLGGLRKGVPNEAVRVSIRVTDSVKPGTAVQQSAQGDPGLLDERTSQNKGLDGRRRHERREVSEERGRQVRYGERAWLRPRLHLRGVELSVVVGQRPPRGPRFQPVQLRRSGGIDGVRAVTRGSLSSARRRSGSGRQQLRGARRRNVGSEL